MVLILSLKISLLKSDVDADANIIRAPQGFAGAL